MSEAVSCGGVVIFRGKVLVLYKNFMNSRDGWVLPKREKLMNRQLCVK